ncbi:MAG: MFS transporter [Desulfobacteraceae bacterium]|nr:MFS transporter [Desulfobacteraceae bacterium]
MTLLSENRNATIDTLWNRPFVFLNLCCFLIFTNLGLLYLYPLALDAMGNDKHATGWIMGIFSIAAVLSRPFLGKLAIRKGEYWVISLGLLLSLAASLSYNLITAFNPVLLFIRIVHGVGFSAFIAGSFSLLAREISPLKRGAAFSMVGVSIMAAIGLAPSIGEAVINQYGFHGLYMAAALSVILAWVALVIGLRPAPFMGQEGHQTGVRYLPLLKDRPFLFLLCSTLIFAHSQATVVNFLALIAAQNDSSSGRFFFVSYFTAIIILICIGRAIDRYGKLFLLCMGYPFLSLSIILIPNTIESLIFSITAILFGTGMGVLFATHNALAASFGSMEEKPAVMSIFTAVYDMGFFTGAVMSGWLASHIGLDMLFISSGFFAFLGLIVAMFSPMKER